MGGMRSLIAIMLAAVSLALYACSEEPASAGDAGARDAHVPPGTDAASLEDAAREGDGGGTTSDAGPPAGSAGCGMPATIATGTWVEQSLDVDGTARVYFVWLPEGYDPSRAYPIDYQFHGCSDSATRETNNVPVQRESGSDAIHVRGRALGRCWDTAPAGPDVAFFDALVPAVEGSFCADPERRFATGYSGGAFMTHRLACIRGELLRGVATIAGGQAGRMCTGRVAALLIHDRGDATVNISASEGARDAYVEANGCDAAAARTPTDHPPCEAYAGCEAGLPVVWCETTGMNHARQDGLAAPAFWDFLSSLP